MFKNKKLIIGITITFLGTILFFGSFKMLPDLKPIGASIAIFIIGISIFTTEFLNKKWNKRMIFGILITFLGIISSFATIEKLPDFKPFLSMVLVLVSGLSLFVWGLIQAKKEAVIKKINYFNTFGYIVTVGLIFISLILLPQINWQHPKDPAAVMILSFFSALLLLYSLIANHPTKQQMVWAGFIFLINFCFIPLYERGMADFIGKFYRFFIPFYEKFDPYAQIIEWFLIGLTIILVIAISILMKIKKIRLNDYGNVTLLYFLIQPLLAIFLFEMMGLPAGFLAGSTTRSDLLVTNTNAVMSTFGMIFIAVPIYMVFELFPFWLAPIFAGFWWVFWKPWLLHHPDPKTFTGFEVFWPAAKFLFLTGLKRVALPMVILLLIIYFLKPIKKIKK